VEINGLVFEGIFLKSLNDKIQRDTILIPRANGLIGHLSRISEVGERISRFNRWACKCQATWGIGNTATLKRIERLAIAKSVPSEFGLRTVAHHFGAVPALPVGEIQRGGRQYFITVLPSLADMPIKNKLEDKTEILLSFQRYLPHLLTAYYEQIGFYLRAIFFGADDKHIIKYAHRIRSIAKGSIRGKIVEIHNDHIGMNRLISDELRKAHERDIQIAEAVDAFGHLVTGTWNPMPCCCYRRVENNSHQEAEQLKKKS